MEFMWFRRCSYEHLSKPSSPWSPGICWI